MHLPPFLPRRLPFIAIFLFLLAVAFVVLSDCWISRSTSGLHFDRLNELPHHRVALVPGCAAYLKDGRSNPYFLHRVNAAAELFHAGKCDSLLVSGDHGTQHYNEPAALRSALISRGVPDARIFSDYAGFRTLDSVVRAKDVFSQEELIIVSQRFHNERAVFIATRKGIRAVGYNAADVPPTAHFRTGLREKFARVKTMIDLYLTDTQPKFRGPRILIPGKEKSWNEQPAQPEETGTKAPGCSQE